MVSLLQQEALFSLNDISFLLIFDYFPEEEQPHPQEDGVSSTSNSSNSISTSELDVFFDLLANLDVLLDFTEFFIIFPPL